jgi:hypothetical protein
LTFTAADELAARRITAEPSELFSKATVDLKKQPEP